MTQTNDNFIMLPKVDICFKGLMNNPKVRKGFIAALLQKDPRTIRKTSLLPTVLRQDYPDDKLGILDVRVEMEDKTQVDMEMQILELRKIPKEPENEEDVIKWMRFLGGKSRKEFRNMAKTNEYIAEACKVLERMSADERAKLEYEARERAIRDYNSQMDSALRRGMKKGMEKGIEKGKEEMLYEQIRKKLAKGKTPAEIADELEDTEENIRTLIGRLENRLQTDKGTVL